jgi:miniconductance mechanosensitive channel
MLGWVRDILIRSGISETAATRLSYAIDFGIILIIGLVARYVLRTVIVHIVHAHARRTKNQWDDALIDKHVFRRIANFVPILLFYGLAEEFGSIDYAIVRLAGVAIVLNAVFVIAAILDAGECIYRSYDISKERPIKGFVQVVKIILWIIGSIIAVGLILDKSPWLFVSGIGAMSAVLLLIFRDSILGFVAGVQLTSNDMVRIGDWIEMPRFNADGEVIEITLNTVKVQNWDKTISMIPAYSLISDSFRNWRGMQESGGRRIKRSVHIDVTSVTFCTEEMLDSLEHIERIRDYVSSRRAEVRSYNEQRGVDTETLINGRRMTNLGTFRAYMAAYLQDHSHIRHDMITMVRQLPPGPQGLPLEIYAFADETTWVTYEEIQADIFDHILAAAPQFGLRIYQAPSGQDIRFISGGEHEATGPCDEDTTSS